MAGAAVKTPLMWAVVIVAGINSVLSLAYYAPMINRMYRREPSEVVQRGKSVPWGILVPLLIVAAAILVMGVWPTSMGFITDKAAGTMMWFYLN